MVNGGQIASGTFSSGNSGSVKVSAGSINIDNKGSPLYTGISCTANVGSTGNAGNIDVTTTGNLSLFILAKLVQSLLAQASPVPSTSMQLRCL